MLENQRSSVQITANSHWKGPRNISYLHSWDHSIS